MRKDGDPELYWRERISKEIVWACEHSVDPCSECKELSYFIKNRLRYAS